MVYLNTRPFFGWTRFLVVFVRIVKFFVGQRFLSLVFDLFILFIAFYEALDDGIFFWTGAAHFLNVLADLVEAEVQIDHLSYHLSLFLPHWPPFGRYCFGLDCFHLGRDIQLDHFQLTELVVVYLFRLICAVYQHIFGIIELVFLILLHWQPGDLLNLLLLPPHLHIANNIAKQPNPPPDRYLLVLKATVVFPTDILRLTLILMLLDHSPSQPTPDPDGIVRVGVAVVGIEKREESGPGDCLFGRSDESAHVRNYYQNQLAQVQSHQVWVSLKNPFPSGFAAVHPQNTAIIKSQTAVVHNAPIGRIVLIGHPLEVRPRTGIDILLHILQLIDRFLQQAVLLADLGCFLCQPGGSLIGRQGRDTFDAAELAGIG